MFMLTINLLRWVFIIKIQLIEVHNWNSLMNINSIIYRMKEYKWRQNDIISVYRFKPPVENYYYWPCQGGTLIFTLFYVCLTCIFNELMLDWRHVCVCMCMRVLFLRDGCMFFCVTFPAWAFSYLLTVHALCNCIILSILNFKMHWSMHPYCPEDHFT